MGNILKLTMSNLTTSSHDQRFLTRLESLRGLGALSVACAHSFVLFPYASQEYPLQTAVQTLMHILSPGKSALIVFFIISGYVLSLSLDRAELTAKSVFTFYRRRIFRIFPAHILWIFVALGLFALFHTPVQIPQASGWFNEMYTGEMSVLHVIANLALIITSINPGEWTLTVELIVYLLYPILYFLNRKSGKIGNAFLLLFLVSLSFLAPDVKVLYYLYAFYVGLSAPLFYRRLIERVSQRTGTILLWTSVVLLFVFPVFLGVLTFVSTAGQVLTAGFLVFACIYMKTDSAIFRGLDGALVQRLGQVSYSFYVIHFIVNYWVAYVLFGVLGYELASEIRLLFMFVVFIVAVGITYPLACLSYDRVEAPMMAYSRHGGGAKEKNALVPLSA